MFDVAENASGGWRWTEGYRDWDMRYQNKIHDVGIQYNAGEHRKIEGTSTRQASGDNYAQATYGVNEATASSEQIRMEPVNFSCGLRTVDVE